MSTKKNLPFISYAYTIGAFLVLIGHSLVNGAPGFTLCWDNVRTFIYFVHMPLFFFVAGFLMTYTKGEKRESYKSFIKKKSIKFLTPYFVLTAVGLLPKILLNGSMFDKAEPSINYVLKAIFYPRLNVWGHMWFLPALLILYSVSYLLLKAREKDIAVRIISTVLILLAIFPIRTHLLAINDLCKIAVYFWLGILSADRIIKNEKKFFNGVLGAISLVTAIAVYTVFINNYWIYFRSPYSKVWDTMYYIVNFLTALLCIYSILCFAKKLEQNDIKSLDFFTGKTFCIYILSWPVQAVTQYYLLTKTSFNYGIVFIIMLVIGFVFPIAVFEIFKFLQKRLPCKKLMAFLGLIIGVN